MAKKPKQRADGRYETTIKLDGVVQHIYGATPRLLAANVEAARQRDAQQLRGGKESVEAFLLRWLALRQPYLARKTYENYERAFRLQAIPAFGQRRLDRLRAEEIQAMLTAMLTHDPPYKPGTIRLTYVALNVALNYAVKHRYLVANPCALVDVPHVPEPERRPMTAEAARTFLAAVHDDRLAALYVLMLTTGLRIGEALGLRWQDVNAGTIHLRVQLQRTRGQWLLTPLKGKRSRLLTLPAVALAALAAHPAVPNERDLLFTTADGAPLYANLIRVHFQRVLAEAGLPPQTPHDLRHTAASLLAAQGAHLVEVQALLGHANSGITAAIYTHSFPASQRRVATLMDGLFVAGKSSEKSSAEDANPAETGKP